MVAIVGGSKVSTKLTVLESLAEKVDQLVVGGGIANTFLMATGKNIGKSLAENDAVTEAKEHYREDGRAQRGGAHSRSTWCAARNFRRRPQRPSKTAGDVADDDMIFDIGPERRELLATSS